MYIFILSFIATDYLCNTGSLKCGSECFTLGTPTG